MSNSEKISWVDGVYISDRAMGLSVVDPGVAVGLGVFDSLCAYQGVIFEFGKHYDRLVEGASRLGLSCPSKEKLLTALEGVIEKNHYSEKKCRLRITLLATADLEGNGTKTIVSAADFPQRSEAAELILSESRVNERSALAGVKSTSYAEYWLAYQEAQHKGATEALMLNSSGCVCEGATSNVFLVVDGELVTPNLQSGCLPGVARATVMELAAELKIPVKECVVDSEMLERAESLFLTSSLREVQPVSRLGDKHYEICQITERLRDAYRRKVRESGTQ